MAEKLYQRCPLCRGSLRLPEPARVNTGGTTTDCPCRGAPFPGWAEVGLTVGQTDRLVSERDKLLAFKAWVHAYLDGQGVPHHPPGPHGAEGCRIGDRMDWLMARLRGAEGQRDTCADLLPETFYSGRPLEERIARLVEGWRRGVEAAKRLDELRAACAAALDALTVAVEAGCDDDETRAAALKGHRVLNLLRAALAATKGGEAP